MPGKMFPPAHSLPLKKKYMLLRIPLEDDAFVNVKVVDDVLEI
jgi:hypothetical protein